MFNRVKVLLKQIANSGNSHLVWLSRVEQALISDIRERNLTYLSERRLASLAHSCRSIEDRAIPGIFIEAGCALGGSTILLSKLKARKRPLYVYDVFGMIHAPTSDDTQDVHGRYTIIREASQKASVGTGTMATKKICTT